MPEAPGLVEQTSTFSQVPQHSQPALILSRVLSIVIVVDIQVARAQSS
jgi:hypothetical protein